MGRAQRNPSLAPFLHAPDLDPNPLELLATPKDLLSPVPPAARLRKALVALLLKSVIQVKVCGHLLLPAP